MSDPTALLIVAIMFALLAGLLLGQASKMPRDDR
jgi:hypothetical protein